VTEFSAVWAYTPNMDSGEAQKSEAPEIPYAGFSKADAGIGDLFASVLLPAA